MSAPSYDEDQGRKANENDALDDVDVGKDSLLELEEFGRLHEVLELKDALGHVVSLAPLLEPRNVVLNLHG